MPKWHQSWVIELTVWAIFVFQVLNLDYKWSTIEIWNMPQKQRQNRVRENAENQQKI